MVAAYIIFMVLSTVGIILFFVWIDKLQKKKNEAEKNEPRTTECPDCGGLVSKEAETCPHCGHVFKKEEASSGGGGFFSVFFGVIFAILFLLFVLPRLLH